MLKSRFDSTREESPERFEKASFDSKRPKSTFQNSLDGLFNKKPVPFAASKPTSDARPKDSLNSVTGNSMANNSPSHDSKRAPLPPKPTRPTSNSSSIAHTVTQNSSAQSELLTPNTHFQSIDFKEVHLPNGPRTLDITTFPNNRPQTRKSNANCGQYHSSFAESILTPPIILARPLTYRFPRHLVWKQPSNVYQRPCLFSNLDACDLVGSEQSSVTFLNAIAALSYNPKLVVRLFEETNVGSDVKVSLFRNGRWHVSPVTANIATLNKQTKSISCCNSTSQQNWAALLEKAYWGLFGSSREMSILQALRDLTGAPVSLHQTRDPSISGCLEMALQEGFTVLAVLHNPVPSNWNLTPHLCLPVESVSQKNIVTLLNCWGIQSSGPISSPCSQNIDIPLAQLSSLVSHLAICHVNSDYFSQAHQCQHTAGSYSSFAITVQTQTHVYFSVDQTDRRDYSLGKEQPYRGCRLLLFGQDLIASGLTRNSRSTFLEATLAPGNYTLCCIIDNSRKGASVTVGASSSNPLNMERNCTMKQPNLLNAALQKMNLLQKQKGQLQSNVEEWVLFIAKLNLVVLTLTNTSRNPTKIVKDYSSWKLGDCAIIDPKLNDLVQNKNMQKIQSTILGNETITWVFQPTEEVKSSIF